jgi:hypothetical protein
MNRVTNFLNRLFNRDQIEEMQHLAQMAHKAMKPDRQNTFKPRSSYGFRGSPRVLKDRFAPAPTIDQVRNLERRYKCKLHVKQGFIYFTNGELFSHQKARVALKSLISP